MFTEKNAKKIIFSENHIQEKNVNSNQRIPK